MNLEIVIPVYEALAYLAPLLVMIDEHYPDRKLVLVDDCSGEEMRQFLITYSNQEKNTVLLRRERRGWFTRAANTGLRSVLSKNGDRPDWVLVLNSDCTVGAGGIEELLEVWQLAQEANTQYRVGMVGADGPKPHCPRWRVVTEPEYCTGHALLFSTALMVEQDLLFPWKDGQVQGFSAQHLVHIASDRALGWEMNRRGLQTVVSYHAAIGHHGGKSWSHLIGSIPPVSAVGEE